jgi:hypothetical protein
LWLLIIAAKTEEVNASWRGARISAYDPANIPARLLSSLFLLSVSFFYVFAKLEKSEQI